MKNVETFKVVLVSFPVHPLHALKHFLGKLRGTITHETTISYFWGTPAAHREMPHDPSILYIVGTTVDELRQEIRMLSRTWDGRKLTAQDKEILEALVVFCSHTVYEVVRKREDVDAIFRILCGKETPREILQSLSRLFGHCLRNHINPLRDELDVLLPAVLEPKTYLQLPPVPGKNRPIRLHARWRRLMPSWAKQDHALRFTLPESAAWKLIGQHFVILCGGSRGMGKTTTAANIFLALQEILVELKNHILWRSFAVEVGAIDLDLARPKLNSVFSGFGHIRERVIPFMQSWNRELALEALSDLAHAKSHANIVVADMPGGYPPDHITEIVSALGDAAIIMESDPEKVKTWKTFFRNMGIPVVAILRGGEKWATPLEPEFTDPEHSVICLARGEHPCKGFERRMRPRDPFIWALAQMLFFSILPKMATDRESIRRMCHHHVGTTGHIVHDKRVGAIHNH